MTQKGHHLILGKLTDFLTGRVVDDTHDERFLQKIAKMLVLEKGYDRGEIIARAGLVAGAGEKRAIVRIDFQVRLRGKIVMIVKYAPGSLVTRHRPALAAGRLLAACQIPVVVVTNGEDADILDGSTGRVLDSGLASIPSRSELVARMDDFAFEEISEERAVMESRIVYAYEVDGSCPCDDSVCRL